MRDSQNEWSRRKFIAAVTGSGAAILFIPFSLWAANEIDPEVAAIVAKTIGIDTHNHIDVPLNSAELPGPKVDLSVEMTKSGLSAICMTFAVDYQKLTKTGEAYERFINGLDAMDEVLKSNNINRALNFADIKAAHKKNQPTVIQSVEGGHFLEGQIERLEAAYKRGLRHLGLLHDNDASVPLGDIYTKPAQWGGLTDFGKSVIAKCNSLGILVDLTHCSNATIDAALKIARQPIIISHTGLNTQLGKNPDFAKMMMPRLISKEQAKIVADAGGVIGVWTHLSATPMEYVQNVRAMVNIAGVEHVCIGTDTKLTPAYRPVDNSSTKLKDNQAPPDGRNSDTIQQNQNQQNNGRNSERIGERTNGAWQDQKAGFYYTVIDTMLKTGFKEDEIAKIGGGNFCRVFDAATARH
jgi:membrane dipeptidase